MFDELFEKIEALEIDLKEVQFVEDKELDNKLLSEGKVKDLHFQFVDSKEVPEDIFNKFVEKDPSRERCKYLPWMLKQYTVNPRRDQHIVDVVELFDRLVHKGKLKGAESDIYQYSLEEADQIASGKTEVKTRGEKEKETKAEAKRVKETDRYLIVIPKSYGASCFYGANTKWCISGRTTSYWENYWKKGVNIYIVIDKKRNKKYAVAVRPDGKKEVFDEEDKTIPFASLKKRLDISF